MAVSRPSLHVAGKTGSLYEHVNITTLVTLTEVAGKPVAHLMFGLSCCLKCPCAQQAGMMLRICGKAMLFLNWCSVCLDAGLGSGFCALSSGGIQDLCT